MSGSPAFGTPKVIIEAKIIRKDGKVENLGEVASTEKGNIQIGPKALKRLFGKKNK